MKANHLFTYMSIAYLWADQSYCERRKVGALVVTESGSMYSGYNGMPSGLPNVCEIDGITNQLVIHAEQNAFDKMLLEGVSAKGSVLFTTTEPCIECSKRIFQSGIRKVFYANKHYKTHDGIEFLKSVGVEVEYFNVNR